MRLLNRRLDVVSGRRVLHARERARHPQLEVGRHQMPDGGLLFGRVNRLRRRFSGHAPVPDGLGLAGFRRERGDVEPGRNPADGAATRRRPVYTRRDLDQRFREIEGKAEVVEMIHDTEYGMREFIIKDPDGFWLTFGEPRTT